MESSISHERSLVQLDPTAFLADPELIRALSEHATPIVCDTDRILFSRTIPPWVSISFMRAKRRSA